MPVKDLILGLCGILLVLFAAFAGWIFRSEYYLFLPVFRRRNFRNGSTVPPTSFGSVVSLIAIALVIFLFSRRIASVFFTALPVVALLGIPIGILVYGWTPGWAHYLLTLALCGMAMFLW